MAKVPEPGVRLGGHESVKGLAHETTVACDIRINRKELLNKKQQKKSADKLEL